MLRILSPRALDPERSRPYVGDVSGSFWRLGRI
jgi:hypothetical protein